MPRPPPTVGCCALALTVLSGCTSAPAPRPAAAPRVELPSAPPAETECNQDAPNQPDDIRPKMRAKGEEIRRCLLIGAQTDQSILVKLDLLVSQEGAIKRMHIASGTDLDTAARSCCKKSLEKVTFSRFCGEDVEVHWSYEIR